jgi:hypothetical protein
VEFAIIQAAELVFRFHPFNTDQLEHKAAILLRQMALLIQVRELAETALLQAAQVWLL